MQIYKIPTTVVIGYVKDNNGKPVSDAEVYLSSISNMSVSSLSYMSYQYDWESIAEQIGIKGTISDENGFYSLVVPDIEPSQSYIGISMKAKKTGYALYGNKFGISVMHRKNYNEKMPDIIMSPSSSIKGKVLDYKGKAKKTLVVISNRSQTICKSYSIYRTWSDEYGNFCFADIQPGIYKIFYQDVYETYSKPFNRNAVIVKVNEAIDLGNIEIIPTVRLSGKASSLPVLHNSKEPGILRASIVSIDPRFNCSASCLTDKNGKFSFDVVPGKYKITLSYFEFVRTKEINVPAKGLSNIVVEYAY